MNEYTVSWSIQVVADSLVDAASEANMIMKDPDNQALFFEVIEGTHEGMLLPDGEIVDLDEGY